MIYLIRSYGIGGKSFLKIGYSDTLEHRLSQYFYSNPGCEIMSIREGDFNLESLLHLYLRYLGFQYKKNGKLDEWYIDSPEIYQIFHIHQRTLEKRIWKHREEVFDCSEVSKSRVFEYLYEKNKENFVGESYLIKEGEIIKVKSKKIDRVFWKFYSRKQLDPGFLLEEKYNEELRRVVSEFLDTKFYGTGIFEDKLRMYCEFMDKYHNNHGVTEIVNSRITNSRFSQFYSYFGTSGCSSRKYRENLLLEAWGNDSKEEKLRKEIYLTFKEGDRYPVKELKKKIGDIYKSLGITKTPKATDLRKYFKLISTRITLPDKSLINGFRLDKL